MLNKLHMVGVHIFSLALIIAGVGYINDFQPLTWHDFMGLLLIVIGLAKKTR